MQDKFKEQVQIMREKDAAREETIKELERQKEDSTTFVSQLEGRVEAYCLRIEQLESGISDEQVQKQVLCVFVCVRTRALAFTHGNKCECKAGYVTRVYGRIECSQGGRDAQRSA